MASNKAKNTKLADRIADLCFQKYNELPKKGKPNKFEWTYMAGIVKVEGWQRGGGYDVDSLRMEVVSLGTGSKCIGQSKLSCNGDILNDSHAEVMARRGFLRYLYEQMYEHRMLNSHIFEGTTCEGKCILKQNITFHFFITHTPCGDASIFPKAIMYEEGPGNCLKGSESVANENSNVSAETGSSAGTAFGDLICETLSTGPYESCKRRSDSYKNSQEVKRLKMDDQGNKMGDPDKDLSMQHYYDNDIHRTGGKCLRNEERQDSHLPGSAYHTVGAVRTKPGRGDPTLSVSCSDKLARWNAVGVQGALLAQLLDRPIYFQTIVIAGGVPFSETAMFRAVRGRLQKHANCLKDPFIVASPLLLQSTVPFIDARIKDKNPCPSSIVWCHVKERDLEVAVGGKKQGFTKKATQTISGRLSICKKELFKQYFHVMHLFKVRHLLIPLTSNQVLDDDQVDEMTYLTAKNKARDYQDAWRTIRAAAFPAWSSKCSALLLFTPEDKAPTVLNLQTLQRYRRV
ncbi:hypothetical protein R5R35_001656 [Gryllus longicercus]